MFKTPNGKKCHHSLDQANIKCAHGYSAQYGISRANQYMYTMYIAQIVQYGIFLVIYMYKYSWLHNVTFITLCHFSKWMVSTPGGKKCQHSF